MTCTYCWPIVGRWQSCRILICGMHEFIGLFTPIEKSFCYQLHEYFDLRNSFQILQNNWFWKEYHFKNLSQQSYGSQIYESQYSHSNWPEIFWLVHYKKGPIRLRPLPYLQEYDTQNAYKLSSWHFLDGKNTVKCISH